MTEEFFAMAIVATIAIPLVTVSVLLPKIEGAFKKEAFVFLCAGITPFAWFFVIGQYTHRFAWLADTAFRSEVAVGITTAHWILVVGLIDYLEKQGKSGGG
jgi:hypothetical protein